MGNDGELYNEWVCSLEILQRMLFIVTPISSSRSAKFIHQRTVRFFTDKRWLPRTPAGAYENLRSDKSVKKLLRSKIHGTISIIHDE